MYIIQREALAHDRAAPSACTVRRRGIGAVRRRQGLRFPPFAEGLSFLESVPEVSPKLKEPNTKDRKFEDVVKSAEQAAVLVLVY